MILEKGIYEFTTKDPSFDWASVSSSSPSIVSVFRNGELEDKVHVNGPTHTWWSNNPMFVPPLHDNEVVKIVIEGPAVMRLECVGLVLKE